MAWPYNKLAEVAEAVAVEIAETLGAKFYMKGKEYDPDGDMIFTIAQCGDKLLCVEFKLSISADDVRKGFWEGMVE